MKNTVIIFVLAICAGCDRDPCHGFSTCSEYADNVAVRAWQIDPDINRTNVAEHCNFILDSSGGEEDCERILKKVAEMKESGEKEEIISRKQQERILRGGTQL